MAASLSPPLITVHEHDPVLMRLLKAALTGAGYRTQLLPNSSAAYETIKDEQPALVLLDSWPETRDAGRTLLQILRLDDETKQIPVLVCSSEGQELEKLEPAPTPVGYTEILYKPFDIDDLVSKIRSMLRAKDAQKRLPPSDTGE